MDLLQHQDLLRSVEGNLRIECKIEQLAFDSRCVHPNSLFFCKGAAFSSVYLQEAADMGCIAYISEQPIKTAQQLPGIIVRDIRKTLSAVSAMFFDYTPGRPVLTGITGTKGKTTTAWYLKAMLDDWMREKGEAETGLISTVENYDGKCRSDAVMTTPEAPVLHEMIANAKNESLSYLTMEVSSQALKYKRVRDLQFQVGIFLNISEDHISPIEHRDFKDYFSSKLSIFRQVKTACINLDADYHEQILKAAHKAETVLTFGRHPNADIRCSEIHVSSAGLSFCVTCDRLSEHFSLAMKGRFNIENALAAISAAYVYGVPVACMKRALANTVVPGRMEDYYSWDRRICGIVDFAHNRLSFERLFDAAFQEYSDYKKIYTVFGCPGGKALNRRQELGILAGLFSDHVFITSDDPGLECPQEIAEEIRRYVEMTGSPCSCIDQREQAVLMAVKQAAENREKTLILLLGRGSEKYQKIGSTACPYPTDASLMKRGLELYDAKYSRRNYG
jgi:UDP-N-acetylmuramoyl-L-alanyl-D-glutamate--2,6-diaminopimelate ligase